MKGVSLLIFRHHYPEWLILEVGADRPGDIESVSKWLKTDIVIITRFGDVPVHVEFFDSIEHLVREKAFLIDSLKKDGLLKRIDWLLVIGLLFIGFESNKRAIWFIMPVIIALMVLYVPRIKVSTKIIFLSIVAVPLVFYLGVRLTPTLNK